MNDTQIDFLKVLAHTYMQHAKWNQCLLILTLLARADPENAWPHLCLAFIHLQLKHSSLAIKALNLASRYAKGKERYLAELLKSRALWDEGHKNEAQGLMMQYLSDLPEQPMLT